MDGLHLVIIVGERDVCTDGINIVLTADKAASCRFLKQKRRAYNTMIPELLPRSLPRSSKGKTGGQALEEYHPAARWNQREGTRCVLVATIKYVFETTLSMHVPRTPCLDQTLQGGHETRQVKRWAETRVPNNEFLGEEVCLPACGSRCRGNIGPSKKLHNLDHAIFPPPGPRGTRA